MKLINRTLGRKLSTFGLWTTKVMRVELVALSWVMRVELVALMR